jgi:3-hydroxyisobutyrate dehydrogenase-like beta-hydroxyacid dehydrogenase
MKIGFVGIGAMGECMVRNLLKAGHAVSVFNRTRERAEALVSDGAQLADRIEDAAACEIVITMLANDDATIGTV